jgi:ribosomal protein S14
MSLGGRGMFFFVETRDFGGSEEGLVGTTNKFLRIPLYYKLPGIPGGLSQTMPKRKEGGRRGCEKCGNKRYSSSRWCWCSKPKVVAEAHPNKSKYQKCQKCGRYHKERADGECPRYS